MSDVRRTLINLREGSTKSVQVISSLAGTKEALTFFSQIHSAIRTANLSYEPLYLIIASHQRMFSSAFMAQRKRPQHSNSFVSFSDDLIETVHCIYQEIKLSEESNESSLFSFFKAIPGQFMLPEAQETANQILSRCLAGNSIEKRIALLGLLLEKYPKMNLEVESVEDVTIAAMLIRYNPDKFSYLKDSFPSDKHVLIAYMSCCGSVQETVLLVLTELDDSDLVHAALSVCTQETLDQIQDQVRLFQYIVSHFSPSNALAKFLSLRRSSADDTLISWLRDSPITAPFIRCISSFLSTHYCPEFEDVLITALQMSWPSKPILEDIQVHVLRSLSHLPNHGLDLQDFLRSDNPKIRWNAWNAWNKVLRKDEVEKLLLDEQEPKVRTAIQRYQGRHNLCLREKG